jgi:hypothetical protein
MWTRIYAVLGSLVLLGYGFAAMTGREIGTLGSETPQQAAARHAAGGHRSHGYGFFFFRGGK